MKIRRTSVLYWLPIAFALLSACSEMAPTMLPVQTAGQPFTSVRLYGIATEPQSDITSAPLRILLIHGMGTDLYPPDGPCALSAVITGLANSLHMPIQTPVERRDDTTCGGLIVPSPKRLKVPNTTLEAKFYTYYFRNADNTRTMQVSFLLWVPLTYDLKMTPIMSEQGHPSWALLTGLAKGFMQTHLGDVVLYGGAYRVPMRAAVEQAMCYFINGEPDITGHHCAHGDASARTVVITHSLGGYMLMDAVADLQAAHPNEDVSGIAAGTSDNAATMMLYRTGLLFMLANQLALLDLTTEATYPPVSPRQGPSANDGRDPEPHGALGPFMRYWKASRRPADAAMPRQIVGVSDPNDLLTYLLSPGEIDVPDDTVVANVYLGVAWNVANVAASPVSAHVNYLTDPTVMNIMVCGMTGNAVAQCTP
jgi:hypothetical protein